MTEFLISASFFLIPLFLGMSLVAKYIDIKQANIQAARYQAWEYTVWFGNDTVRGINFSNGKINNGGEVTSGFTIFPFPVKTVAATREETKQRFYTDPGDEKSTYPITAGDATTGWTTASANPLWTDHKGIPLYAGVDGANVNLANSTETPTIPVIGTLVNLLLKGVGLIFGLVGNLMSLVGSNVGFNAITTEGYANVTESMSVAAPPNYLTMDGNDVSLVSLGSAATSLTFDSSAAVLSDAWNTGGTEHTYYQVGGMVPTTLLNGLINSIPGLSTVWSIATVLAPELRLCKPGILPNGNPDPLSPWPVTDKGGMWLGHIDIDAVHPDRLIADPSDPDVRIGSHAVDDAGMANFTYTDPAYARTDATRDCVKY